MALKFESDLIVFYKLTISNVKFSLFKKNKTSK